MPAAEIARVSTQIDQIYRKDSRRIFATLIRLLGDFERAEEALHDAFRAAMEKWPSEGLPQNPVAWLVSAGRFKSIDKQRRDQRFEHLEDRPDVAESLADQAPALDEKEELEDDRLRLVFTCCHPALASDAQVALTLREVCGLATEEIAAAFLTPAPTIAQRIVRAKSKIRDANIPYQVPARDELPERLESVLRVRVPGVQRRLFGQQRRLGHARGSVGRSDPAWPSHRGAHSRTRSARIAGAHAAARIAPRDARDAGRRTDPAR